MTIRLLLCIVFLLRVLLGLSVLLLLHTSWTIPHPQQQHGFYSSISGTGHQGQQSLNLTAIHGGGGGGSVGGPTTIVVATATPTSVYQYHHHDKQQQYESVKTTHPDEHAVELAAAPSPSLEETEQQQTLVLQQPDTLYTIAWAPYLLQQLHASPPGQLIADIAHTLPPSLVFPLCLLLLYLTTQRIHTTESLLVLRGLGIQTSSTGGNYLHWPFGGGSSGSGDSGGGGGLAGGGGKTRFIPTEKIRDVLINEAFRGFGVRYYLVVVVDGEEDVVVVFPGLLPRRAIVERVWRGVRGCLWEPQDGVGGNSISIRKGEDRTSSG